MKRLTIQNKHKVHTGPPTPAISKKSKTYPIKTAKHEKMPKPQQEKSTKINGVPCAKPKKIKVVASDKDVRAVGGRAGVDNVLYAKFPKSKHLDVGGESKGKKKPVRVASGSPSGKRKPKRSGVDPSTEIGAVSVALRAALGGAQVNRPGFGQQPQSGSNTGSYREQQVRRDRTVR